MKEWAEEFVDEVSYALFSLSIGDDWKQGVIVDFVPHNIALVRLFPELTRTVTVNLVPALCKVTTAQNAADILREYFPHAPQRVSLATVLMAAQDFDNDDYTPEVLRLVACRRLALALMRENPHDFRAAVIVAVNFFEGREISAMTEEEEDRLTYYITNAIDFCFFSEKLTERCVVELAHANEVILNWMGV